MDLDLATIYSQKPNMLDTILFMQDKYTELQSWTTDIFHRRFSKLVKKAVKKVQLQSQLSEDSTFPSINRLEKDQMRRLIRMPQAESVRCKLLSYFLLE
jgi:DNA replication initiation complex subunit (GINS family)